MGKPTGFLEYERKGNKEITPLERIKNFNEFHVPMSHEERKEQAARCMDWCSVLSIRHDDRRNGFGMSIEQYVSGME